MANFPFHDLHGFKDYVVFVRMCAPDRFPEREGMPDDEQWTLDLPFQGLRTGLQQAKETKGPRAELDEFGVLVERAHAHYLGGQAKDGFVALEQANRVLKRIRTE